MACQKDRKVEPKLQDEERGQSRWTWGRIHAVARHKQQHAGKGRTHDAMVSGGAAASANTPGEVWQSARGREGRDVRCGGRPAGERRAGPWREWPPGAEKGELDKAGGREKGIDEGSRGRTRAKGGRRGRRRKGVVSGWALAGGGGGLEEEKNDGGFRRLRMGLG